MTSILDFFYQEQARYTFLGNFDFSKYDLYVYEDEIIRNGTQITIEGKISEKDLKEIFSDSKTLVVFMNLQAFPINSEIRRIKKIQDFSTSLCEFVILTTDVSCVEFYAKKGTCFSAFLKGIVEKEDVNLKHQKEIFRTQLSVW